MRRLPLFLVVALGLALPPAAHADCTLDPALRRPRVVVALIDTGINPYSLAFRDSSPEATRHPCEYISGYPADALPLELTLDTRSVREAFATDRPIWEGLFQQTLYYVPGTKIVGAISLGSGGTYCRKPGLPPPAGTLNSIGCEEFTIFDDHGHGTMTASRATSFIHSLGSDVDVRVVMIEGLGTGGVIWASESGWVDVQSNSWGSLVPSAQPNSTSRAITQAAGRHLVMFASGNGLGGFQGWATWPTYVQATGAPGAVEVGGHDNGRVSHWSNGPAHLVTDAYAGWTGLNDALDVKPDPMACCTSTSSPYAAGGAAAILLEARRVLGDTGAGVRTVDVAGVPTAVAAIGTPPPGLTGPLSDGMLTLQEWRRILFRTAEARPDEGRDDGLLHWTGGPSLPQHPEYGPGENPYCQGCWTSPVRWTQVGPEVPAYLNIGYGAVNERSVALAAAVLRGLAPEPVRPDEDAWYAQDQQNRRTIFGG